MEITDEQDAIASCQDKNLVVNAFAGTGKTTTLVEYARRRPKDRLMYVAFNRSIKEEAARKFPSNTRCVTTHGLAFPSHGKQFQTKFGNPKAYHLSNALSLDMVSAGRVVEVITNFLTSTDAQIEERHAIHVAPKANVSVIAGMVDYARRAWKMMQDTSNTAVPMPHDGYLKLYQLSKPTINTGIILFDEAQDANPITLDFISRQRCNKVFVGDKYQSIYGFRGAVDALAHIKADSELLLTSSFRFGSGVAALASHILADWRGCRHAIRGLGQHKTLFSVDRNRPHAVIARTNGGLFAEAVMLVTSNKPFGFVGGVEGYRFDQILDTYNLSRNSHGLIKDPFIASFDDFAQMKQYGESLDDKEVKSLVKVVETYTHDIPQLIEEIKTRAIQKLTGGEVAMATTHKAKGLEWMDVVMTDDFTDLEVHYDKNGREVQPEPEEVNILYVALTRAMRGLQLPPQTIDWLHSTGRAGLLSGGGHRAQDTVSAAASTGSAKGQSAELKRWCDEMGQYLGKICSSYSASPDEAKVVASFLEEQAAKFRAVGGK